MIERIQDADWAILNWIRRHLRCGFLNFLMPKITWLGNLGLVWLAIAGMMIFRGTFRNGGILVIVGLCIGVLVGNLFLKHLVARSRPCWFRAPKEMLITMPNGYSFPSGHALSSAIAATILTATDGKFALVAILLAVLIAFSRLYLGVHFPSDVLCSAVLGVGIGLLVYFPGGKLLQNLLARAVILPQPFR